MTKLPKAATAAALVLTAVQAQAQCSPTNPSAGQTVTCTGVHTSEVDDVSEGIIVRLDNTAKILPGGDRGLDLSGDAVEIYVGEDTSSTAEITSTGNDAIRLEGPDGLIINYGTIDGDDEAIQSHDFDGLKLYNYGDILAGDEGVTGDDGVEIYNYAGATIKAMDDAVNLGLGAKIENWGLIENIGPSGPAPDFPQDAVDIDSGTITNYATGIIRSTFDAAIDFDDDDGSGATITNYGLITGTYGIEVEKGGGADPANTSSQAVINFGRIVGTDGIAVDLGAGEDSFRWMAGSTVYGALDLGDDDDLFEIDGPTSFADMIFADGGFGIDIVKFGGVTLADFTSAVLSGDTMLLSLFGNGWDLNLSLTGWELFDLGSRIYTSSELVDAVSPAPVPLPAAGWVFLGGLGLLAAVRRRRG
ncbi:VPLPA-CTERM sorting domain-containing protein [Pseudoruegeria sp. HB172150]|uniref:VPLPA-CTERM sorting domain-containing protein n=1 Tax=Pseudoruegeria sp. HB172150 TaxID=2721164 RepID=UPI0015576ECD|nr:VPLPA-CTERM sorting domain-containing protein [Pseudoruegeria sp. HB172150]